ncbi:MAG: hypothetical protein VX779_00045 [Candidatus Thermoplasmatota archaeon]|nr:hypothetical protein [Candidatus Thermoplasmatota archaeon]
MGLLDSLRRILPRRAPRDPKSRWEFLTDGTCRDNSRDGESVWRAGVNRFESLLHEVEKRTENSLGRRLAHAALEHEERFMRLGNVAKPSGRDPTAWLDYFSDWESRGLGRFRLLDDEKGIRILAEGPASGPICAGALAAAWECATSRRHRFTWSDGSTDGLIVSLIEQHTDVPSPKPLRAPWMTYDSTVLPSNDNQYHWADYRADGGGTWSIMGERKMMIHLDLISRFEEYCIPYVKDNNFTRSEDYAWDGSDHKHSAWWDAVADSAREGFVLEGHHVLVRDHSDWISIARRHLSSHGLGALRETKQTDAHGGVLLTFSGVFHPAIASGILLGCWERAYGRNGRVVFSLESDKSTLELRSSRAIAD